jgi:hypothetical protein
MYIYVLRRVKTLSYFIPETAPSKLDIHFFIINEQKTVFNEQKNRSIASWHVHSIHYYSTFIDKCGGYLPSDSYDFDFPPN